MGVVFYALGVIAIRNMVKSIRDYETQGLRPCKIGRMTPGRATVVVGVWGGGKI